MATRIGVHKLTEREYTIGTMGIHLASPVAQLLDVDLRLVQTKAKRSQRPAESVSVVDTPEIISTTASLLLLSAISAISMALPLDLTVISTASPPPVTLPVTADERPIAESVGVTFDGGGGVGYSADCTEGFSGLRICHNLAFGGVYPREILVLAVAGYERTILNVVGDVVSTADVVKVVFAVPIVVGVEAGVGDTLACRREAGSVEHSADCNSAG
ncbi:hypothetical protein BDQ17DRAFT_1325950 [Cyathus striatus]|nr:hypothetical protein BDQ17DRAFT_1325950 [Cyathus striatus]